MANFKHCEMGDVNPHASLCTGLSMRQDDDRFDRFKVHWKYMHAFAY